MNELWIMGIIFCMDTHKWKDKYSISHFNKLMYFHLKEKKRVKLLDKKYIFYVI